MERISSTQELEQAIAVAFPQTNKQERKDAIAQLRAANRKHGGA